MAGLIFGTLSAATFSGCGPRRPEIPAESPAVPENAYSVGGKTYYRLDSAHEFVEEGVASWYGAPFHAKNTANGEVYDMEAMTAAHKTLPFGTMVLVKNLENNRTVVVRINDRGPFCRDRIIDLSRRAAREIGMIRNGTAAVEISALGMDADVLAQHDLNGSDSPYFTGEFTIQAGAFTDPGNAENLQKSILGMGGNARIIPVQKGGTTFYRVRVGPFASLYQARRMEERLMECGIENVFTLAGGVEP